ncbi:MAG: hypothetical protein R3F35_16350 [Myxococcota bacterium]
MNALSLHRSPARPSRRLVLARTLVPVLLLAAGLASGAALAQGVGPATHLEWSLVHEEYVGGNLAVTSDANPGQDDLDLVEDLQFMNATYGTHSVNLRAQVDAQENGAPILRARGEHTWDLTGTDRQTDVWTGVDGDQLLRATLVDQLVVTGIGAGADFSLEFYWDVTGTDDVLIDLVPPDSLYAFLSTRVRLEATGASGSDAYEETIPWSPTYLTEDVDKDKQLEEYVEVTLPGTGGVPLAVETAFEVEPDTRLDNEVELRGTALDVEGHHVAAFDQSAELIGVIVRDGFGAIVPFATVIADSGFVYPVLDQVPVAPIPARTILSPVAVVGNSLGTYNSSVPEGNMIDQSGLTKPFASGVTGFDRYFDFSPTPNANANYLNNWQSVVSFTLPVTGTLDFDLGGTYWIDRLAIWNRSLENVRILVSDSASGPWQEVAQHTLPNRLFYTFSYPYDVIDLGGEYEADYVRIQVDSAYQYSASDSFAYAIVGEVALSAATTPLPEPAAAAMAFAGVAGLAGLGRARRTSRR